MKTVTENKDNIFSALKGLAIVLVVYGHIIQRSMVLAGEDFFSHPVFKIIYTFHMPLFFFISGYLLAFSLRRRSVGEVFKSRWQSLFLPLVAWGILGVLTSFLLGGVDGKNFELVSLSNLVDYLAKNMEVWFIWFLFTLFVSSALLSLCVYLKPWFGKWVFVIGYLFVLLIPFNNFFSFYYVKWFYLFYLAGYLVNEFGTKIIVKCNNAAVFAICLILFSIFAAYWVKSDYIYVNKMSFLTMNYVQEILRFAYRYFVSFLGIIVMFFLGSFLIKARFAKILGYIGIFSLDIYLLQRYLVEGLYPRILARANYNFDFNSPFFLFFFAPAVVAASIFICIAISKLLFRKIPLFNKVFLGNRL